MKKAIETEIRKGLPELKEAIKKEFNNYFVTDFNLKGDYFVKGARKLALDINSINKSIELAEGDEITLQVIEDTIKKYSIAYLTNLQIHYNKIDKIYNQLVSCFKTRNISKYTNDREVSIETCYKEVEEDVFIVKVEFCYRDTWDGFRKNQEYNIGKITTDGTNINVEDYKIFNDVVNFVKEVCGKLGAYLKEAEISLVSGKVLKVDNYPGFKATLSIEDIDMLYESYVYRARSDLDLWQKGYCEYDGFITSLNKKTLTELSKETEFKNIPLDNVLEGTMAVHEILTALGAVESRAIGCETSIIDNKSVWVDDIDWVTNKEKMRKAEYTVNSLINSNFPLECLQVESWNYAKIAVKVGDLIDLYCLVSKRGIIYLNPNMIRVLKKIKEFKNLDENSPEDATIDFHHLIKDLDIF